MKKCVKEVFTGDGKQLSLKNVSSRQLKIGTKVEMEHTDQKKIAKRIALDHLAENPKYYDYLNKMEKEMDLKLRKSGKK
jgi:hypothetical protein